MESWVSIDKNKCNDCGICYLRCPRCFFTRDGEVMVRADENCCNLCGHCVALCPTGAIAHEMVDMNNFITVGKGVNFDTDAFIQFIRQRRSHRHFKDREIPKKVIQKLIDTCRYAPTGSNVQDVEIMVVKDPGWRQGLSDLTVDFFAELAEKAQQARETLEAEGREAPSVLQRALQYGDRLSLARRAGIDPIFWSAPAVFFFHSPTDTSAPKDNCVIASTIMNLTARTMGLEATFIGLFEFASRSYQPLIEELNLPPGHEVYSVLIMGYPLLRFLKTVDRRPIKTKWV